jgi:hypothetical protein
MTNVMSGMHPGLAALAGDESSGPPGASAFRGLIARVKALVQNREALRVVFGKQIILGRSFFAPTTFSKPESREVWLQRVRGNFAHYRSIYAIVFVIVLVYTVLSSPLLLLGLTLLAGAWAYAFVLTSPETPIMVAGFELRRREKLLALGPFSLLVVVICGLINSLVWVLFLTVLLSLPHASFHEVVELDALDALELESLQTGVPTAV